MTWTPIPRGAALLLLLLAGNLAGAGATTAPGGAIVRSAGWTPGGAVRDGAAEMLMLMQIARLRHASGDTGLVAVGDRRGLFPAGVEAVLQLAVLRGVPVVKLATGGRVLPAPHGLFLDAGNLSESEAAAVLCRCLALHGALPAATPASPTGEISPRLREQLDQFQREFTLAAAVRLAVR